MFDWLTLNAGENLKQKPCKHTQHARFGGLSQNRCRKLGGHELETLEEKRREGAMFVRCKTLTFGPFPRQWKRFSLTFAMIKITTTTENADVLYRKRKKRKRKTRKKLQLSLRSGAAPVLRIY